MVNVLQIPWCTILPLILAMKIEVKLSLFIFHQLAFFALKSSCVAAQQVQNGLPWITFKMWGIFHLRIRRKRWISSHILLYGTNSNYKNTLKYQKIKWHSKLFWEQKMWYPTLTFWCKVGYPKDIETFLCWS